MTARFDSKKEIPSLAAARLQQQVILLSTYDYDVKFKPTQEHGNADALSRLPLPIKDLPPAGNIETVRIFNMAQIQPLPVTFQQVKAATRQDPTQSKIMAHAQSSWPNHVTEELKDITTPDMKSAFKMNANVGVRIIIPKQLQATILHENHPGIMQMKAIARSHVWWSGIDQDIKHKAKQCILCQEQQSLPAVAPLHPWVWPNAPWK